MSGYGAPVRPAPDLQREWNLSGGCGGAGVRALAGGLLLGDLPEGASGSHTGTLVLLVRPCICSDHSLSLPADPSSPASAASFCAGAPAFPQCVGGLEMRGPRTGPSWLPVPWLGTAS